MTLQHTCGFEELERRTITFDTPTPSGVFTPDQSECLFGVKSHNFEFETIYIDDVAHPAFYAVCTKEGAGADKKMVLSAQGFEQDWQGNPQTNQHTMQVEMELIAFWSNYPYSRTANERGAYKKTFQLPAAIMDIRSQSNAHQHHRKSYACYDNTVQAQTRYKADEWAQPTHRTTELFRWDVAGAIGENSEFEIIPNFDADTYKEMYEFYRFEGRNVPDFPMYLGIKSISVINVFNTLPFDDEDYWLTDEDGKPAGTRLNVWPKSGTTENH